MKNAILLYLAVFLSALASAATRLVPDQYPTIQAAIDACTEGDVVVVAPGTYRGDGNRDIDFKGKAITVRSEQGPKTCIVDCQGSADERHRGFHFHSGEDANSTLVGFTITNGFVSFTDFGGGIYCSGSSPRITDCVAIGNRATAGGGIACFGSNAVVTDCVIRGNSASSGGGIGVGGPHPMVSNCIITGNRAGWYGGGVACGGNPVLAGCVICGNRADHGGGVAAGAAHGDKGVLRNCIIWANAAKYGEQIGRGPGGIVGDMSLEIAYCVLQDGPDAIHDPADLVEGEWISVDPLFVRPGYWDPNDTPDIPGDDLWVHGDYHLKSQAGRWDPDSKNWVKDEVTSPCIDAGDPKTPIGDEPFPNGGRINMGAYGGTAEASKSYFGEPICTTIVSGDINGDCKVDFADLVLLAYHWLENKIRR